MTTLLTLQDAELAFGDQPLLDHANLTVMDGERIGVIGRNGTGKSSLLRVIAGADKLDDGSKTVMDGLGIAYVEQEPFLPEANTLRESLILRGKLNEENDEQIKWRQIARLDEYLHRFELDGDRPLQGASGGEKKRAALALAFTQNKDLLLLDEPTNHLDIDAILILEELIKSEYRGSKSLMVITHDRAFLDSVSTRIIELDRGVLRSYPGNFEAYENRKEQELAAEDIARRKFDKFWAQEEVWIRKGIEARRTRNEGRVRRLERLREERAARRDRLGQINLNIDAGMKSGKIVAELEKVSLAFGDKVIVKDLNFRLLRGDRLGLVGHNGVGKSTLINRLVGKKATNVGNRPGVTKQLEWIRINDKLELLDTPGMLWPKLDNAEVALSLAATTAIKEEILDIDEVAMYIIRKLQKDYPDNLYERYKVEANDDIVIALDKIGKKIGAVRNGEVDYDKVYHVILKDLREGYLGKVTLDNLQQIAKYK